MLFDKANLKDKEIVNSHLVFTIAPRINAAGRIDHAHLGVKLLLSTDDAEADEYAKEIEEQNAFRKDSKIGEGTRYYPMPSRDDLRGKYYRWWRSANR